MYMEIALLSSPDTHTTMVLMFARKIFVCSLFNNDECTMGKKIPHFSCILQCANQHSLSNLTQNLMEVFSHQQAAERAQTDNSSLTDANIFLLICVNN